MKFNKKIIAIIIAAIFIYALYSSGIMDSFNLTNIQKNAIPLKKVVNNNYLLSGLIYIAIFVTFTLFTPTAAVLTLLAGYLFGGFSGGLVILIATTLGSISGSLLSRLVIGNWVQNKWPNQLSKFNSHVSKSGSFYLVSIRMLPFLSYSMVNYLLGLTAVPMPTIAWTTALGSIPVIYTFSYAGKDLLTIESIDNIMSSKSLIALSVLLLTGACLKLYIKLIKHKKIAYNKT